MQMMSNVSYVTFSINRYLKEKDKYIVNRCTFFVFLSCIFIFL